MSYVNRNFTWDFNALKRFYEKYVIKWINSAVSWTDAQKKQARANLGFGDGDIDEKPTAGSYNPVNSGGVYDLVTEKSVIELCDIASSRPSGMSAGEVYFNTRLNALIVVLGDGGQGSPYKEIPISKNGLFRYKDSYLQWNGTNLVPLKDLTSLNETLNEKIDRIYNSDNRKPLKSAEFFEINPHGSIGYDFSAKGSSWLTFNISLDVVPDNVIQILIHDAVTDSETRIYNDTPTSTDISFEYQISSGVIVDHIRFFNASTNPTLFVKAFIYVENSDSIISTLNLLSLSLLEQGGLSTSGKDANSDTNIRSKEFIKGNYYLSVPSDYIFRRVAYYNMDGTFDSTVTINESSCKVGKDNCKFRISIQRKDGANLTVDDFPSSFPSIEALSPSPMVEYDISEQMFDYSDELIGVRFDAEHYMEDVYAKFDSLVSAYPQLISKEDAAIVAGLEYPEYANGIDTEGTYLITPSYKTYCYKLIYNNPFINTVNNKKRNIIITSGLHGWEIAGSFNTYLLASNILKRCYADRFFTQILSEYNIYIIPCVNGYGIYHGTRVNANGVNLNRNMPTIGWVVSGEGTGDYTGPSACSEFESKIIKHYIDTIKPDVVIDHHNYNGELKQFYTEAYSTKYCHVLYDALVKCSYAFIKYLPEYFGTDFRLFNDASTHMPGNISNHIGTVAKYGYDQGHVAATIEICDNIRYTNTAGSSHTKFTADVFKVGEYTLRCELGCIFNALNKGKL